MFNYKQSVYDIQLKYLKNNFEYSLDMINGERIESSNSIKIFNSKNLFSENEIKLDMSNNYLLTLQRLLKSIKKSLSKENIDFSAQVSLHNEKVLINGKEDERSYGLLRLIFKKCDSITMDDISITESDPNDLESQIKYYLEINKKIIAFKSNTKKHQVFKSIPVVLSSQAAGYFIHEILGHTLENDFYSYYKNQYSGLQFSTKLTVKDSVEGFNHLIGINKYDDKGTKIKPLTLIENGKICNVFALEEKDSFDHRLYGIARRENYRFDVLPRMRCTYILPYDNIDQKDILSKYQKSILIDKTYSGEVNPQTGNYNIIGNGFIVKNGEKQNFIENLKLSGNIVKDFLEFDYIGNDIKIFGSYCAKLGQTVRVGIGAPTVSILNMTVDGDVYV